MLVKSQRTSLNHELYFLSASRTKAPFNLRINGTWCVPSCWSCFGRSPSPNNSGLTCSRKFTLIDRLWLLAPVSKANRKKVHLWRMIILFCFHRDVHAVCLWDDKGPAKIHQALKEDILDFIKQAQAVRRGAEFHFCFSKLFYKATNNETDAVTIINFAFSSQRVLSHQDDTALLKAYIVEWRKFFTQCDILPKPFCQLEITLMGKQGSNKKSNVEDSIVRKVKTSRSGQTMRPK